MQWSELYSFTFLKRMTAKYADSLAKWHNMTKTNHKPFDFYIFPFYFFIKSLGSNCPLFLVPKKCQVVIINRGSLPANDITYFREWNLTRAFIPRCWFRLRNSQREWQEERYRQSGDSWDFGIMGKVNILDNTWWNEPG